MLRRAESVRDGVFYVFRASCVFKIQVMIVSLVSVLMVHLKSQRSRANECRSNKRVNLFP